ncbi:uncharacterized protein LOC120088030 [Benincasa hispida]|uniref:uncharacterized protein LOC120088030 n=1 Tax=Benincasa hispida TaxID=102211 RepID=UPI0018FF50FE|nr:uncharacterized protein LOC120088030 [Benincasa hispida]
MLQAYLCKRSLYQCGVESTALQCLSTRCIGRQKAKRGMKKQRQALIWPRKVKEQVTVVPELVGERETPRWLLRQLHVGWFHLLLKPMCHPCHGLIQLSTKEEYDGRF